MRARVDRLARSTSDLYRIVSELTPRGVEFKVLDDPSIDGATVPEIMRRTKLSKASIYLHLGCNPSRSGLARLDGLTMGICDECGERLIEIEDHPPMLWRLTATTLNSCGRSSMRSAPTMEDSCGC